MPQAKIKKEGQFVHGPHSNATRIPNDLWEKLKDEIVKKYKDDDATLEATMKHMEPIWLANGRGEPPTRRQYVHRLGPRLWKIKKYGSKEPGTLKKQSQRPKKKGVSGSSLLPIRSVKNEEPREPSPYNPRLTDQGERTRAHQLAEILLALGDTHYSFLINAALHDSNPSEEAVIFCVRNAQTSRQAATALKMLNAHTNEPWVREDKSWANFLFLVMAARCYDWPPYVDSGLYQIEGIVKDTIHQDETERERLIELIPRGTRFDIRLYQFLSFTLERYNEPTDEDDKLLDVGRVLGQFKDQQLSATRVAQNAVDPKLRGDPLDEINCLAEVLAWCYNELQKDLYIDVPTGGDDIGEVNQVLCTLWALWVRSSPPQDRLEENIHKQLGISATELLSIVVSMIMAAGGQTDELTLDPKPRALTGARMLKGLNRQQLFDQFLRKVYSINLELMSPGSDEYLLPDQEINAAKSVNPFRAFVAKELGIDDLPDLPDGFHVPQLLTVDYDPSGSKSNTQTPTAGSRRPSPGLLGSSHAAQSRPRSRNGSTANSDDKAQIDHHRRRSSSGLLNPQTVQTRPRSRNGSSGGSSSTAATNGNRRKIVDGKNSTEKVKDKDNKDSKRYSASSGEDISMTDAPDVDSSGKETPPYD
ncbi:hypothetical protein QBC35DRAFT_222779 [Podospora australis]|uniref:Clr5 domain-containing protein n=1 Tax=Podospora australis TaxID=1536484 RepID=A0AAN6X1N1_9PEZI|nr:hypothetical protein QBC35DRAFT_222779 [Podospora australis]